MYKNSNQPLKKTTGISHIVGIWIWCHQWYHMPIHSEHSRICNIYIMIMSTRQSLRSTSSHHLQYRFCVFFEFLFWFSAWISVSMKIYIWFMDDIFLLYLSANTATFDLFTPFRIDFLRDFIVYYDENLSLSSSSSTTWK